MTGVINEGAEEREGLAELGEWQAGSEDEMKPVLASAADITKTEEGGLTISIGEGDDNEVEVSAAAMLIHKMTLNKLSSWVLVRLRALCTKRKRGAAHFRTEEAEARATAAAAARARGATRRASGGASLLRRQLAEAQEGSNSQ